MLLFYNQMFFMFLGFEQFFERFCHCFYHIIQNYERILILRLPHLLIFRSQEYEGPDI